MGPLRRPFWMSGYCLRHRWSYTDITAALFSSNMKSCQIILYKLFFFFFYFTKSCQNYPTGISLLGNGLMVCGKMLPPSESSTAQLRSHASKCKRRRRRNKTAPLRRPSAIPAGSSHTTPACSQWWCSNLTEWAQGFVCLKPLTYFYNHCRSQSLYCVIAELMLRVYSKTERNCLVERYLRCVSKKNPNKKTDIFQSLSDFKKKQLVKHLFHNCGSIIYHVLRQHSSTFVLTAWYPLKDISSCCKHQSNMLQVGEWVSFHS